MTPEDIIVKLACDEHRCAIFRELRLEERLESGELHYRPVKTRRRKAVKFDQEGRLCYWHEVGNIEDRTLPESDGRYVLAKTHRQLTEAGEVCFSGRHDPKFIVKGNVRCTSI